MATPPPGFRYDDERRPIWDRPLPDAAYRKIFHGNAQRFLGL